MPASQVMVKPRTPGDKVPSFPATPAYKQWIWDEIRRRKWTLQRLVDEMKRVDRSQSNGAITSKTRTATLIELLGAEHDPKRYHSNTVLMPSINKALGLAQPSVCTPDSPLSQLKDAIDERWREMHEREREQLLKAMEAMLGLSRR